MTKKIMAISLIGCFLALGAFTAHAQAYPNKPIHLVVPYAVGGANDQVARVIAAELQTSMNQSVVVENKPGAGGVVGTTYATKAAPDGYTLVVGEPGAISINPRLTKTPAYDPVKDLIPVASLSEVQMLVVANPATKINSLKDLASYGKGKNISYGSAGTGTAQHLTMELLKHTMHLEMTHIPYRGGAPAMTDLIGGQIPILPITLPTAISQIKAGQIVPIAALTRTRSAALPNLPTAAEQGYPSLNVSIWQGIFVPAGTPQPIVDKLGAEIRKALADPETRKRLTNQGLEILDMPREQFVSLVNKDIARWKDVIQQSNLTTQ